MPFPLAVAIASSNARAEMLAAFVACCCISGARMLDFEGADAAISSASPLCRIALITRADFSFEHLSQRVSLLTRRDVDFDFYELGA